MYASITEYEILWRDMYWVEETINRILRDRGEHRRFDLQAILMSTAYAFGGEKMAEQWQAFLDSTYTEEEYREIVEAQAEEDRKRLAQERYERAKAMSEAGQDNFLMTRFDPAEVAAAAAKQSS